MPLSPADAASLYNAEFRAIAYTGPAAFYLALHTGLTPVLTRAVTDGVLNSTTALTSATAGFSPNDVGHGVAGVGIPAGTTVQTYNSPTSVTMSAPATATATGVSVTITGNEVSGGSYARQLLNLGAPAAGTGAGMSSNAQSFTGMPAGQLLSLSFCDAATNGALRVAGTMGQTPVNTGNTVAFAAGNVTASIV